MHLSCLCVQALFEPDRLTTRTRRPARMLLDEDEDDDDDEDGMDGGGLIFM